MAKIEAVIIRRSDEENTIAIVTAECDLEMVANHVALIGAVANAVTRWAKHGRGKELLARKGTINVGDLAYELTDDVLLGELEVEGVTALTIENHAGFWTAWDYDDDLANNE